MGPIKNKHSEPYRLLSHTLTLSHPSPWKGLHSTLSQHDTLYINTLTTKLLLAMNIMQTSCIKTLCTYIQVQSLYELYVFSVSCQNTEWSNYYILQKVWIHLFSTYSGLRHGGGIHPIPSILCYDRCSYEEVTVRSFWRPLFHLIFSWRRESTAPPPNPWLAAYRL